MCVRECTRRRPSGRWRALCTACSASLMSSSIASARSRKAWPASVTLRLRLVRSTSCTPSSSSSALMRREMVAGERLRLRAAAERLPLRWVATKMRNESRAFISKDAKKLCVRW
ncbi:hypothetical protein D3C72_1698340 [compost metagenome]